MKKLLHNSRFYILAGNIFLSGIIYLVITQTIPSGLFQTVKIQQIYSLLSLFYLYIALLIGPFIYTFPIPWKEEIKHTRRAIGVSAFYFGLLHVLLSFFGQLGGFGGLGFLDSKYLFAISTGFVGFIILFLLTITSLDAVVNWMHFKNWKLLQRLVYIGGILILIHIVLLGTHFSNLAGPISQITFFALAFLLLLEAPRIDAVLKKFIKLPRFGVSFVITLALLTTLYFVIINPIFSTSGQISFDIHAAHKQLALEALQQSQSQLFSGTNKYLSSIPGLQGDRTRRYTVSMTTDPVDPQPNEDVTIHFAVYDASSGNPINFFHTLYAWPMHLMIVDSALAYFEHDHPIQQGSEFIYTTQFPSAGLYHLYIQFQPFGGIEQQMAFTLRVGIGEDDQIAFSTQPVDTNLTKVFGDYAVTLNTHGQLNADQMSQGNQKLTFTIRDAKTKKPITTLKPFMASFGHLTMINEKTYDFIHVHPYSLTVPAPDANGGPSVDFLPIGIYGPFKPGVYRAFAEFSTKVGEDFDTDFTIKIQ